jgi:hypothetical protein
MRAAALGGKVSGRGRNTLRRKRGPASLQQIYDRIDLDTLATQGYAGPLQMSITNGPNQRSVSQAEAYRLPPILPCSKITHSTGHLHTLVDRLCGIGR